jgi:hypothetical protein
MKRLLIAFLLLSVAYTTQAQNDYGGNGGFGQVINGDGWLRPGGGNVRGGGGNGSSGKNVIKIRLDGLPQSKFGLGYERVLNRKFTIGINGFYQLPQKNSSLSEDFGLLFESVLDNFSAEKETLQGIFPSNYGFQGSEINKYFIMPEVRYYFKNAPRGFFAGLYFKYRSYDYSNKLLYTDSFSAAEPINYDFDFNVQMNTASAGLSFGIQTFLLKRISLDLILFGIQYSSNIGEINITRNDSPLPGDVQADIQTGVDYINANLPLVDNIFRLRENTPDFVNIESRFTSPSIRFPSIRLGIRF